MKKLVFLGAAAAALTMAVTPIVAQVAQSVRPGAGLTRAEVQTRVRDAFVRIDRNRDGFVTRSEADANVAAVRGERRRHRQERREARFTRLDANRDGAISRDEFFARRDRAERGDRAERRPARMERRAQRRELRQERRGMRGLRFGPRGFERMDANRDGRVSLAEATGQSLRRFDRVDADRDGRITREERRAVRAGRSGDRS